MQKRIENCERPAAAQISPEFVFTERAAAHFLNTSPSTLRRDRASGHAGGIPFVRIGSRVVYMREALEGWLRERQQRPVPRANATPAPSVRRGRPNKNEQIEAARLGLTIAQLRKAARAGGEQ